jgi:RHS repeat-associated protein
MLAADGVRERFQLFNSGLLVDDGVFDADAAGRITGARGVLRAYDGNGLLASAGDLVFFHDGFSLLTRIEQAVNPLVECRRDPLGRLHRIASGGVDLRAVYDGFRLVEVRNASGALVLYLRDDENGALLEVAQGGASLRPLLDLSGSVRGLADAAGTLVAILRYDPFGRLEASAGTLPFPLLAFQSLLLLPNTEFYLTDSRAYDPSTGSFIEPDSAGLADGIDRYTFARGNPYAYADPGGLMAQEQGRTGRGSTTGTHNPHGHGGTGTHHPSGAGGGEDHELRWYERALLAMGGAIGSLVDTFIVEPAKMVYDIGGLGVESLGLATGWWDYEHAVASGVGHMAAGGKDTGDILATMGRNIVETPGRLWKAIERGDYWEFGAESMNIYTVGRTVTGVARGTAKWTFNRGVKVLGRLRPAEPALGGVPKSCFEVPPVRRALAFCGCAIFALFLRLSRGL